MAYQSKTDNISEQVIREMAKAMELLGAQSDLLCIVGSFRETLSDEQVLDALREWNTLHGLPK